MFGNVTELKDLALPPMEEINNLKVEDSPRNNDREVFKFDSKDVDKLLALIPVDPKQRKYEYDVLEFNAIMESLSKTVTPKRRWWWPWLENIVNFVATQAENAFKAVVTFLTEAAVATWDFVVTLVGRNDGYDSDYYRHREDSSDWVNLEYDKMEKLEKLMVCLLIHARYRVDHAIRQRKSTIDEGPMPSLRSRGKTRSPRTTADSKAYRLGYLFNRLRRTRYMQAKALQSSNIERIAADVIAPAFAVVHDNFGWKLVRWYQKMIHLDQDVRDLCTLVQETVDEDAIEPKWNPKQLEKMKFS